MLKLYLIVIAIVLQGTDKTAAKTFMTASSVSILSSFIYWMLYVSACVGVVGSFPIFEFIFSLFDVIRKFL